MESQNESRNADVADLTITHSEESIIALSTTSGDSAASSSSAYFRRRFDNGMTRRAALEQRSVATATAAHHVRRSRGDSQNSTQQQLQQSLSIENPPPPPPPRNVLLADELRPSAGYHPQHSIHNDPPSPPTLTKKRGGKQQDGDYLHHLPFREQLASDSSPVATTQADNSISSNNQHHDTHLSEKNDHPQRAQEKDTAHPVDRRKEEDAPLTYYKIQYRGVVALLESPVSSASKTGAYLGYGEIIASRSFRRQRVVDTSSLNHFGPSTPKRPSFQKANHQYCNSSPTRNEMDAQTDALQSPKTKLQEHNDDDDQHECVIMIQVDQVLTGGYAIDAMETTVESFDKTPKRGNNSQSYISTVGPSPLPFPPLTNNDRTSTNAPAGHILSETNGMLIASPIAAPPRCESGSFTYKVISATPLPIFSGPCSQAPKTKGMLIPGTSHEICLRVYYCDKSAGICFLRLAQRRGWVADHRILQNQSQTHDSSPCLVMKDVSEELSSAHELESSCCNMSVVSNTSSSLVTPVPVTNRRHRAPRRRQRQKTDAAILHVIGPSSSNLSNSNRDASMGSSSHIRSRVGQATSPSSNISLLSDGDDSSMDQSHQRLGNETPDRSVARSATSVSLSVPTYVLMKVNAPRGLKILDAPHFQVNHLIHGSNPAATAISPTNSSGQKGNMSIFQTMGGHHSTAMTSKMTSPAIYDSITKGRKLPRGTVFEASKRMEPSTAFNQGAGLIKLSDSSGWAIVPKGEELDEQYRSYSGSAKESPPTSGFEEVGNAVMDDQHSYCYLRILSKGGIAVSLPAVSSPTSDDDTSPTSSIATSSIISGGQLATTDSDVASSVGSSFLDSMFRTPRKNRESDPTSRDGGQKDASRPPMPDRFHFSIVIPCGMCVEVERWASPEESNDSPRRSSFARLRGGQGWIPRIVNGKTLAEKVTAPDVRFGSFWFRVQDIRGIKVRLGPSRKSPSIKSDDGVYFRFECGEFLRASEVVTFFENGRAQECFAKLYRNRHARLHAAQGEARQLASLTVQAEWVQVFGYNELILEECAAEPRIERHKQGWRYNVVLDARAQVRKGPSFEADPNGVLLLGGESVLINERVTGPHDAMTWLRLKDGQGWVNNSSKLGNAIMIPHSLRHRNTLGRPTKPGRARRDEIAYNTIVARLFHNDGPSEGNDNARTHGGQAYG